MSARSFLLAKSGKATKSTVVKKKRKKKQKVKALFIEKGRAIFAGQKRRLPVHMSYSGTSRESHLCVDDFERYVQKNKKELSSVEEVVNVESKKSELMRRLLPKSKHGVVEEYTDARGLGDSEDGGLRPWSSYRRESSDP